MMVESAIMVDGKLVGYKLEITVNAKLSSQKGFLRREVFVDAKKHKEMVETIAEFYAD